jgi:alpha-tubulin suppressor-like RCC1 family protein
MQPYGAGGTAVTVSSRPAAFDDDSLPLPTKLENVRTVSLGALGGCAIHRDGSTTCWGDLDAGDGSRGLELDPVTAMIQHPVELATHFQHSCAAVNGEIVCWGEDLEGQLGRGSRAMVAKPVQVQPLAASKLAVGTSHACAVTLDNTIRCWGTNELAQAGDSNLQEYLSPTEVTVTLGTIAGIVAAFDHTCVWGGGAASCWGDALGGGLGNGVDARMQSPPAPLNTTNVERVALGFQHLCVQHFDKTVTCFGRNQYGQLGTGSTSYASLGGTKPGLTNASTVVAGQYHTCAIVGSGGGAMYCWGRNDLGQLGTGNYDNKSTPTPIDGSLAGVGAVLEAGAGDNFTCARDNLNKVFCWGQNVYGQLGDGTRTAHVRPVQVGLAAPAVSLFVGARGACAKLTTAVVQCWGESMYGQVGNGTTGDDVVAPVVVQDFATASTVAVGRNGRCAVIGDAVWCTGYQHMLGTGDASRSIPTPISTPLCQ